MELNILALLIFIASGMIGMIAHWYKKKRRGEVNGNLISYMLADYPGRSFTTLTTFLTIAYGAAASGAIDGLNLPHFVELLSNGKLDTGTVGVIASAFMLGWTLDSAVNKGN